MHHRKSYAINSYLNKNLRQTEKDTQMDLIKHTDLSSFTQGYVDAMFFTFDDNLPPDLGFNDLSGKALALILIDCTGFELLNSALLEQAGTPEQNGHDSLVPRRFDKVSMPADC